MPDPRVLAICLPQRLNVTCYQAASLLALGIRIGSEPMDFENVSIVAKGSSMLPHLRCLIAEEAIEKFNATHLLWIDDDHSFPEDTFHRLYRHKKSIVGINASTRSAPIVPTARLTLDEKLVTGKDSHGLQRVYSLGFGIILVEARVFQAMPKPWFRVLCDESSHWVGEDAYFCSQARSLGFEMYVDHDLTKDTHHFGMVGFHSRHAEEAAA